MLHGILQLCQQGKERLAQNGYMKLSTDLMEAIEHSRPCFFFRGPDKFEDKDYKQNVFSSGNYHHSETTYCTYCNKSTANSSARY